LAQPPTKTYPQADGNKLGSPDAPVTVVEFADYLCSHCQDYALNDEQAVIDTYVASGRVYYEYLSIAAEDPSQTRAIEATYCAGDQGALWPYRDLVYANAARTSGALGSDYLTAYARSLELDMGAFDQCLRSGKYGTVNAENLEKAAAANIPGTPTFMVNGTRASRVNLTQVIEAELAKTGSNP
jgi:protein-disulfide isomerase